MEKQELLNFISKIITNGNDRNVEAALLEFADILERVGEPDEFTELVRNLAKANQEASVLGKQKQGAPVSEDEIGKAIREGRERIKRAEAFRC